MIGAAPTILTLETDSAWLVIIAVSVVTFPVVFLLHRLIGRPGGLASGIFLSLPLTLPLVAALLYSHAVLPQVAVMKPAVPALFRRSGDLLHLLLLSQGRARTVVPYALSGSAGPWLLLIGAALSSFMVLRRFLGHLAVRRVLKRCTGLQGDDEARVIPMLTRLAQGAGLARRPEVLILRDGATGAFTTGGRRPRIVLSEDLLEQLDDSELEAILAHEIAHIQAFDVPLMIAAGTLRDVVAWNPFAHVAYKRLASDRESEADVRAAAMTRNPLAMASGLLKMCDLMRRNGTMQHRVSVAFLRSRGPTARRVSRLIRLADGGTSVAQAGWFPYVVAACLAVVVGLQVGARVGRHDGEALAVVWGTPAATQSDVRSFQDIWDLKRAPKRSNAPDVSKKGPLAKLRAQALERLSAYPVAVTERDFPKWVAALAAVAKSHGISPSRVREAARRNWEVVPLVAQPSHIGLYRMELQRSSVAVPLRKAEWLSKVRLRRR